MDKDEKIAIVIAIFWVVVHLLAFILLTAIYLPILKG